MPSLSPPCSSENPNQTQPKLYVDPNPPDPFASLLRDSADRFIADYRDGVNDFSKFTSIFSRLIHSVPDPPVHVVWFYSAVVFHEAKLAAARRDRVSEIKDLFHLLVSCSARGGASERIAALAPVVIELRELALEKRSSDGGGEEIQRLSEGLVSYLSICCAEAREADSGDISLGSHCSDLVRVWMVDRFAVADKLKAFFPIAGDDVITTLRTAAESCGVGYFAGVVMFEAFVLRLCLRFGIEGSRAEFEKDLRNCAHQMISSGFRCFSFLDTFLKTLLEPVLPVAYLLKSKDASFLQKVLYDSVLMVDYSYFKPQLGIPLQSERLKNLAVTWLLVCDNAIRKYGDQSKVISYMTAFSESCLTSHLIKWITNQIDLQGNSVSDFSTPVAIIKWMLLAEEQGVRVFDCEISKVQAKKVICDSRVEYVLPLPVAQPNGEKFVGSDLEMVDSEEAPNIYGQRKRKGTMLEKEIQSKFVKSRVCENLARERFPSLGSDGCLRCENKVNNPFFDGEMVEMEQ